MTLKLRKIELGKIVPLFERESFRLHIQYSEFDTILPVSSIFRSFSGIGLLSNQMQNKPSVYRPFPNL